jgi:hypothetical protein
MKLPNKSRRGVPVGYKHNWNYRTDKWIERKIAPKTWTFTYYQTKHRGGGKVARLGTGMPLGSKLHWRIQANQYAVKTGPNTYRLIMRGTKRQAGYTTNKKGRYRR